MNMLSLFSPLLQGVIDYIFFSRTHMSVLGLLGPLETQWLKEIGRAHV